MDGGRSGRYEPGTMAEGHTITKREPRPDLPPDEASVAADAPPVNTRQWRATLAMLAGAAGGAVAIALMEAFSVRAAIPLMAIPFGTSIVLVMGSPEVEAAQPRALIGGHVVATIVGLVVVTLVGPQPWAAALAVGLAIAAMHVTRTFHPPAGIDPLLVVVNNMPWTFLLVPVAAGAVALALFALVWHLLVRRYAWPKQWW